MGELRRELAHEASEKSRRRGAQWCGRKRWQGTAVRQNPWGQRQAQGEALAQGLRQGAREAARRAGQAAGVGEGKGAQDLRRVRGPRRRRQGRHDQGDHRAGESARVSRGGAAGADRAREDADVPPALPPPLPGGGRGRDLRPQLVQPRRRRAGDGLLHRGAGEAFLELAPRSRRRWSTPASSCSSTGSR